MELDGSDVDDGAIPTQDLDPDYTTSTPVTRRGHTPGKSMSLLTSDRVTRRSGRRVTPSLAEKQSSTVGVSTATDAVDKVCSDGSQGLGFGMEDLDAYYTALEQYKLSGKYPEGATNHQKRVLRKISQSYFIQDKVLYYLQGAKSKRKVVIKLATQRLALLQRAHISDTGGHVCRSKVIERLDSWNVYWKGLTLDCEAFVRACSGCEHGKERQRQDHLTPTKKEETSLSEDDVEIEVDEPAEANDGTDDNYDDLVEYLKHQKFPPKSNRNSRACLKRKSKYFVLINDVLHFVWKDSSVTTPRRVLITEEEKTEAIRDVHSMYHFGRNRTYNMLRENYYWNRMPDDVTEYVKRCPQCEPRNYATEEELAKRRVHMADRVSWFREKIASQEFDVDKSSEVVVQSLLKIEEMETEEVADIPDVTSPAVGQTEQVQQHNSEIKESPPDKTSQIAEETVIESSATDADMSRNTQCVTVESSQDMVDDEEHRDSVIDVKVYSELVEPEGTDSPHVVVETLEGREGDVSPHSESLSVVVESQHTSSSDMPSVSQSSVDKVILVSGTQNILQPALITSRPTSAIISEHGIPVTSGQSIDSASGSVQLVVVPSEQWNAPDLNMLNERVRIPYSCERVSVEQIQDQEQSLILSSVNKAALSSGNALAELVKATVGDLGGEESQEKVSETASAVASIPSAAPQMSSTEQMDIDEDEEVGDDDEDFNPEDEDAESDGEKEEADGETKPKQAVESKKNNKFKCEVCGKDIKGAVTFKMHMYKHTGVKPFSCEICNKKFTNNKSLRIHMRKHTGDTPFLCNLCGKGFSRATSLRYHLKAHEEGGGVPVTCDVCGREFTTSNRLEKHRLAKHPVQAPVFQCAECNKVFTAQRSLKRHMVSHQGIRQYQCQVCGRGFFRKEYLNSHLAQHPEVCQITNTGPKIRARPKKKQIVNLDPSTGLHVQQVVQVSSNQPEVSQASDSTAFVFPQESVQYEVECLTSESTLTEADLKAIHFLAQASIHGQF